MGGRVAVPHMLPYDASKFALAGFSQGLMAELAGEGISVTTIFPALMRTGSPIQAVFKGDHEKEFAWFQAADVLPGFSLAADQAAEKIVAAARPRDSELIPSLPGKARMVAAAFMPETFAGLMALLARMMPEGKSKVAKTGAESRGLFDEKNLLSPFRGRAHEAEKQWNQEPAYDAAFALGQKKTRAYSPGFLPRS
jgi:NAD(P)-dependent dehydrogenase (short-subunit alcohol dehydrogenase family)